MNKMLFFSVACYFIAIFLITPLSAQYSKTTHRTLLEYEVPVSGPGSFDRPGTTYVLVKDISSKRSAIFLGKDVTLDLNGFTIKYADGNYEHIANSGFEEGDSGWDLSKAPGAKVLNTADVHVFIGKKLMSLKAGDEITSGYVYLPIADRSYFAMCGVTGWDYHAMGGNMDNQMKISIYVENEQGTEVKCITRYADSTLVSCPMEKLAPRLGGGFIFAHLNHLPAGKYRVRIKADTDCLVDEIDIRPAMDVGIGIVENTSPLGHYDHLYNCGYTAAFYDYTEDISKKNPLPSIPRVQGYGTVTIRNGVIESGTVGMLSWGIQSTAGKVRIILDNIKIKTSGINTAALEIPQATITNCRFEVDNPFIINRHCGFNAVNIPGTEASEISYCEFIGGQGCLYFRGRNSIIHHNLFVNHQMVTNHYSISASGDSSEIFENRFEPETGSGVWVSRNVEVFNNIFNIKTSPPTCEYGHEEYSTSAIRMADYHRKPGTPDGTNGNKVYNNKIYITANDYPEYKNYIPMAFAVFYSVSGGEDYIFGNDIVVEKSDLTSKAITTAFYICGGPESLGGYFYNNRITTNVPAMWVASMYGGAANTKIFNNTIIKSGTADGEFKPVRMGWSALNECVANNIEFRSNEIRGAPFEVQSTDQNHSYSVYWTLFLKVVDEKENPVINASVIILDKNKIKLLESKTDELGKLRIELMEYSVNGKEKTYLSPYTVKVGDIKKEIFLNQNKEITLDMKKLHPGN